MAPVERFLAFDLGAGSGRTIEGRLEGGRLAMRELTRFANGPVEADGHLRWDFPRLFDEVRRGLRAARSGPPLASLAVDTWGVDFALLGEDGELLEKPVSYRDRRTEGAMESFFARVPRERIYGRTGIQMMPINTLFQLHAMARDGSPHLASARSLLFLPDAFTHILTGVARTERTIASTSQLLDARSGAWAAELFGALGLPVSLMPEIVPTGTVVGRLRGSLAASTGLGPVPVVATASHDTAAAVAAVPAEGDDWAYVSSGTWSLVGVESDGPVIDARTREGNFTNEAGYGGRVRLLKNVTGLWLLEECRRAWAGAGDTDLEALLEAAAKATPHAACLDPDWPGFRSPTDMPAAIEGYLAATGQARPTDRGAMVRLILEGLAFRTARVIAELGELREEPIRRVHLIGGGSRNDLLCRLTAAATGLPILAGPVEATAAGNLLVQAAALGALSGLEEIREVSRRSFPPRRYEPREGRGGDDLRARFAEICGTPPGVR